MEETFSVALARAEDVPGYHEVIFECEDNLFVAISPKAVAQVLFSLLENACHYSFPDTTIPVIAERAGPENVQVALEDEGPGVPQHLREKVFDKFFRSNVSERRDTRAAGLGLGLAIARGIVETHGGKIWIEDRGSGKSGARLVFSVPASKIELSHAEESASQ
ncbi:MAG: ATP-binding protein [Candidatus Acidiferrales bacterium]